MSLLPELFLVPQDLERWVLISGIYWRQSYKTRSIVVDIAGDGSFNMTENSLAVSVLDKLPVIVFLMNNYMLGMVAQWQRTFYKRRYSGVHQQNCPDYAKIAEAYGAQESEHKLWKN